MFRVQRKWQSVLGRRRRLTLLGRSLLLLGSELAVNAVCWIVAGILFGRNESTRPVLSLALLAWVCSTLCYDHKWLADFFPDDRSPAWYVSIFTFFLHMR